MNYKVAIMAFLVLIFLLNSVSWAQETVSNSFASQISSKTASPLEPLIKGGGGRGGISTSKSHVDDVHDNSTGNQTNSSSGNFPWWTVVAILVIIVILALVVIWYLSYAK
jgi:hypothetical protein